MTKTTLKNRITKHLEGLDAEQLEAAYLFVKELTAEKIRTGLAQLENGEGSDFGLFLNEVKTQHGKAE